MSNRGYIDTAVTCAQANPVLPLSVYLTLTDQYSNPDARDSPQIVHKPFHMALISLRIRKVLSGQPGDSHRSLQAYLHPLQNTLEQPQFGKGNRLVEMTRDARHIHARLQQLGRNLMRSIRGRRILESARICDQTNVQGSGNVSGHAEMPCCENLIQDLSG